MSPPLDQHRRASEAASISIALRSAGSLSVLIFLISSIYEVLVINRLHESQHLLLGILLTVLASWAWLEIGVLYRQRVQSGLGVLNVLLGLQLGIILFRHGRDAGLWWSGSEQQASTASGPIFQQALLFFPIYFVLILAIGQSMINAFGHAERLQSRELKRQMQLLALTRTELEASESRYRNFFNLPLVGTGILSSSLDWISSNQASSRILGYPQAELHQTRWSHLIHPDDRDRQLALFDRLLRREQEGFQIETRFMRKDGTTVHALLAAGCSPSEAGATQWLSVNLIDISQRKQAEAELACARRWEQEEAVRQRNLLEHKLKTSLAAAAVVHEIQQPLATILLNCQLTREKLADEPSGRLPSWLEPMLQGLTTNSDQVVTTMERMRQLLRNVQTEASPMELGSLICSALAYLQLELLAQRVCVRSQGLDQPCPMQGDGAQLQIAVVNLIRNALQAMAALPSGCRHLLLQLDRSADAVRIVVADSGPGFAAGVTGEPSWEVLKSSKATGIGIGLFLAQTAASNHHGELHIGRSAELGGAEVVIELPLRRGG